MKINRPFLSPLTLLIIGSIGLTSCGGGLKKTPPPSLVGTHWQLVSLNGAVLDDSLSKRMTLDFNDKRVGDSSGCNRYFSDYQVSGSNSLQFNAIGGTRRMCIKRSSMKIESQFLKTLQSANTYQVNNGMLSIQGGAGVLKFKRP